MCQHPSVDEVTCIPVRFTGSRARSGPLTVGQNDMLAWILRSSEETSLAGIWDVPAMTTVRSVAEHIARLVERHEALRTTYRLTTEPLQVVAERGELNLVIAEGSPAAPV